MRAPRFQAWITDLVDTNLPPDVKRIPWADTGIVADKGMADWTLGLVFEAPSGGVAYLQLVHGGGPKGDTFDKPEEIVEGEPPAPVAPVELTVTEGRLRMAELEAWITALIINAQNREVASVTRFSERDPKGFHPFGFSVKWHSGAAAYGHLRYTLAPGERRSEGTEWRIKETV
jgi:hypothetical protein